MHINEQKKVVTRFLRRCNAYADSMLAGYADRLSRSPPDGADADDLRAKIARWESYRSFNEHALAELATDRLDDWFDGTPGS